MALGFKAERRWFNKNREYRYFGINFTGAQSFDYATDYDIHATALKQEALNMAISEAQAGCANDDVIESLKQLEVI